MTPESTCSALHSLIQVCEDGEKGYRAASQDVDNTEMQTIFLHYADQREKFVHALREEAKRLECGENSGGSVAGAVHRGWMAVKSAVSGHTSEAIVASCESGDDSAKAAYERVVDSVLPGATRLLVEKQWHQVQEAHSHMVRLKGSL